MSGETGWIWTDGHMVGNADFFMTVYNWDGSTHRTSRLAQQVGLRVYGSDDFNIALLRDGVVTWWGWMDEPHPLSDAAEFASQHGFSVAASSSAGGKR